MARKRLTHEQIISKSPRSQALDPIPWSGLQLVPGLT